LSKGKTITRATANEGEIPVIGGGLGPTYYNDVANRKPPVITVSASGANAGFVNYWNIPIWASDCTTIIEKPNSPASIDYIYKYLLSRQEYINTELRRGSAQPHVYPSDIAEIKIPVPSLDQQREIVKKLDSAFTEIDLLGESITNRIKNASELFAEICLIKTSDLNPTGFKSLKEIASVITKGTTPTSLGYRFTSAGINFLKVESLDENGGFIGNKFAFIDSACHESLKRSQLIENDILVSIAGALGRTAIVTGDVCPANVNQALSLIRLPKDSEISPKFLIALFQSGYFKSDLDRMGAGAAQQNLSLAQIGSLKVPIFPESKQKEFIDFLHNLSGLITDLKAQLENQYLLKSELQKSILAKTFLHSTDSELVA
jgi:restriction endonuclease S subunit